MANYDEIIMMSPAAVSGDIMSASVLCLEINEYTFFGHKELNSFYLLLVFFLLLLFLFRLSLSRLLMKGGMEA